MGYRNLSYPSMKDLWWKQKLLRIIKVSCSQEVTYLRFIVGLQRFQQIQQSNRCIHSDELASRNAAVGPYEYTSLNKCDNTIIIYPPLHV